ncbi:hypothetical protein [Breoghania sp.]|uniref:helix-turn-helix domain-containing protein n=1 Tax=Breoghania sp. TaxID=2065378 RepID=UPI002AA7860F|nr:hypothetical protein [Breoghania sp.]
MTPAEFKATRYRLNLTGAELAYILGVDARTIRKWEAEGGSNARKPPPTACRVMEWLLAGFRPRQWPDDRTEFERAVDASPPYKPHVIPLIDRASVETDRTRRRGPYPTRSEPD